jgi:ubiquinone/menaquinone biosynthesis C-methylase UbiE
MATAYCSVSHKYFCMNCATQVTKRTARFASWDYFFGLESPWSGRTEPSLDKLEHDGAHPAQEMADRNIPFPGLSDDARLRLGSEPAQSRVETDLKLDDVRKIWNGNASRWEAALDTDGDETRRYFSDDIMLAMLGPLRGKSIVDLGCGNGYLSRILATAGAEVTGIDLSDAMLTNARAYAQRGNGIRYLQYSITNLSGLDDQHFDSAVCNYVLHDVADYDLALAEVNRVLKPNGSLVLTLTHPCFSSGPRRWQMQVPDSPRQEDAIAYLVDEYFSDTTYMIGNWHGFAPVPYYHRPLSDYWRAFRRQGFTVSDFDEPRINKKGRNELSVRQVEQAERIALCCVFKLRKISPAEGPKC